MRCPKCHYITFGGGDRCRNCGYEFSLSVAVTPPADLPIQRGEAPEGPLADLRLTEDTGVRVAAPAIRPDADAVRPPAPGASPLDLPLFEHGDDTPLVTSPAVPRAPLAVRRGPALAPRPRAERADLPEEGHLDLEADETAREAPARPQLRAVVPEQAAAPGAASSPPGTIAGVGPRLAAGLIDAAIAVTIDGSVIYLTLRFLGLERGAIWTLPLVPLAAFLLLLNGGYFVIFTAAGGQTIGKMATGIRVRCRGRQVPFATAVVRACGYLLATVPVGLGLLPALFDP